MRWGREQRDTTEKGDPTANLVRLARTQQHKEHRGMSGELSGVEPARPSPARGAGQPVNLTWKVGQRTFSTAPRREKGKIRQLPSTPSRAGCAKWATGPRKPIDPRRRAEAARARNVPDGPPVPAERAKEMRRCRGAKQAKVKNCPALRLGQRVGNWPLAHGMHPTRGAAQKRPRHESCRTGRHPAATTKQPSDDY